MAYFPRTLWQKAGVELTDAVSCGFLTKSIAANLFANTITF